MDKNEEDYNLFHNSSYGELTLDQVISSIKTFLECDPDAKYSLVIGTDSHEINEGSSEIKSRSKRINGKKTLNLVTAVVIHRKGFGGKYFWIKKKLSNIHTLREKIYAETITSLNFATKFVPLLKKTLNGSSPDYDLEIHVDVGTHGDTREMIKEVVGMVTGNGFVAKTKPEAYGASYVADKHA